MNDHHQQDARVHGSGGGGMLYAPREAPQQQQQTLEYPLWLPPASPPHDDNNDLASTWRTHNGVPVSTWQHQAAAMPPAPVMMTQQQQQHPQQQHGQKVVTVHQDSLSWDLPCCCECTIHETEKASCCSCDRKSFCTSQSVLNWRTAICLLGLALLIVTIVGIALNYPPTKQASPLPPPPPPLTSAPSIFGETIDDTDGMF